MTMIKLVGLVADLPGTDDHLIEAAPVVVIDDVEYVAEGLDWKVSDLVEVSVSDDRYIHFLKADDCHGIDEGDTVWVAGKNVLDGAMGIQHTRQVGLRLGGWKLVGKGFRWHAGSRRGYSEFVQSFANRLQLALHGFLFDGLEKSHGSAATAYTLYASLPLGRSRERHVDRGLYFAEMRDVYSLEFVRQEAIADRLFETIEEFDKAVESLRDSLATARLSETTAVGHPSPTSQRSDRSLHELLTVLSLRGLESSRSRLVDQWNSANVENDVALR